MSNLALTRTVLLTPLMLAALASCETYEYEAERTATLDVPSAGVERLETRTHNGSFTYRGRTGSGEGFQIVANLKAYGRTQEEADANLQLLAVACDTTDGLMTLGSVFDGPDGVPTAISFEIDGPPTLVLDIETHNGAVRTENTRGPIDLVTHNGSVRLDDVDGPVAAETHNGGVRITGSFEQIHVQTHNGAIAIENRRPGTIDGHLETHNGAIEMTLAADSSTELRASTHNGSISIPDEAKIRYREDDQIEATLGTGQGRMKAITHNGRIKLRTAHKPR